MYFTIASVVAFASVAAIPAEKRQLAPVVTLDSATVTGS
jgi:hypothetical protein